MMKIIETNSLTAEQKKQIHNLWNREYPRELVHERLEDFDQYLEKCGRPVHYLIQEKDKSIQSWACSFTRDLEKWFVVLVKDKVQGLGHGTALVNKITAGESKISGWAIENDNFVKTDGKVYKSPLNFYRKTGFTICPAIKLKSEKISAVKIIWEKKDTAV